MIIRVFSFYQRVLLIECIAFNEYYSTYNKMFRVISSKLTDLKLTLSCPQNSVVINTFEKLAQLLIPLYNNHCYNTIIIEIIEIDL